MEKDFSFDFVSPYALNKKYSELSSNINHSIFKQISYFINYGLTKGVLKSSGKLNSSGFIPGLNWEFSFETCSTFVDPEFIELQIGNNLLKSGWKLLKLVIHLQEQKFDFIIEPIEYK